MSSEFLLSIPKQIKQFMNYFIIFLSLIQFAKAQTIKGIIFDKTTKEPIPFASIGIKGKSIGTVSDEK